MLESAATLFENRKIMLKRLKKKSYEKYMKEFRGQYDMTFLEMTTYMDSQEDKEKAAKDIADAFIQSVKNGFEKRGKISSVTQFDLNLFMIYYVFPAITMTYHEEAKRINDVLCASWGEQLKGAKIGYSDYDTLYNSFNEKILGIF